MKTHSIFYRTEWPGRGSKRCSDLAQRLRSHQERMRSMSDLYLVTGANGRHGSTGAHLVEGLLALDKKVRIFVRRETNETRAFAAKGVEVVVGDLLDQRTIVPALKDVTQA